MYPRWLQCNTSTIFCLYLLNNIYAMEAFQNFENGPSAGYMVACSAQMKQCPNLSWSCKKTASAILMLKVMLLLDWYVPLENFSTSARQIQAAAGARNGRIAVWPPSSDSFSVLFAVIFTSPQTAVKLVLINSLNVHVRVPKLRQN